MKAESTPGLLARVSRVVGDVNWAALHYGTGRFQVLLHLWRLYRNTRCRPFDAHHDGLSNPAIQPRAVAGIIPKSELLALQARLNPASHRALAGDKAVFHTMCVGLGLPVPVLYGVVGRWAGHSADGKPWSAASLEARLGTVKVEDQVVVKPAIGFYGRGVRAYRRTPDGFCDQLSEDHFTIGALADALRSDGSGRVVVQARLQNHPAITALSGTTTLQTTRIRCLVTSDGQVLAGGCFFKIAVGNRVVDNIDGGRTGNFLAAVRLGDGTLGTPVAYSRTDRGIETVERHPETACPLRGFRLPFWDEARKLAERASLLFFPLRTIGWDIAITPTGPVLVEGNPNWDPTNLLAASPADEWYAEEMAALLNALRREAAPR